jgi:hypothetical protein
MTSVCEPLSQACYDGGATCIEDWANAQQLATWCEPPNISYIHIVSQCDGFNVVSVFVVDTTAIYYYDAQSGALVGVRFGSKDGDSCFGQAPEGLVSVCLQSPSVSCESDGAVVD